MESTYVDANGRRQPDRRKDHQLRCAFENAYEIIAPFMDPGNRWGGQSLANLAFRAVRDRFPELPAESVRVLIQVCMRRNTMRKRLAVPAE